MEPLTVIAVGALAVSSYLDNKNDKAQFAELHATDNQIKQVIVDNDRKYTSQFDDLYARSEIDDWKTQRKTTDKAVETASKPWYMNTPGYVPNSKR